VVLADVTEDDVAATEDDVTSAEDDATDAEDEVPTDVAAEVPTDPEEVDDVVPAEEVEDEVMAADVLVVAGAPMIVDGLLYGLLPLLLVARTL